MRTGPFPRPITIDLYGVSECSLAWGDYDNDGDLDLVVAGTADGSTSTARIYTNDNGTFSHITLAGAYNSSVAWGDHDTRRRPRPRHCRKHGKTANSTQGSSPTLTETSPSVRN